MNTSAANFDIMVCFCTEFDHWFPKANRRPLQCGIQGEHSFGTWYSYLKNCRANYSVAWIVTIYPPQNLFRDRAAAIAKNPTVPFDVFDPFYHISVDGNGRQRIRKGLTQSCRELWGRSNVAEISQSRDNFAHSHKLSSSGFVKFRHEPTTAWSQWGMGESEESIMAFSDNNPVSHNLAKSVENGIQVWADVIHQGVPWFLNKSNPYEVVALWTIFPEHAILGFHIGAIKIEACRCNAESMYLHLLMM